MRGRGQAASLDREWDEVWAEHDARLAQGRAPEAAPAVLPADLPARPDPAPKAVRRGGGRWAAAAGLLLLSILWALEPIVTAWQVGKALEGGDAQALARHVNEQAVVAGVRTRLAEATTRVPDGPANAFLEAMADDMARAWANPALAASLARPLLAPPRLQSVGLTGFELEVGASPAPMTLRFQLQDAGLLPRWQVTGIQAEVPVQAFAPPPPVRLSAR
jgi:hypothetical protein